MSESPDPEAPPSPPNPLSQEQERGEQDAHAPDGITPSSIVGRPWSKAGSYLRRMIAPSRDRVALGREMLLQTRRLPDAVLYTDCYTADIKENFIL